MNRALPVGIDNFKEIISRNYYYVDKSLLIRELLDMRGKVNLFTRPRRFGKTLNLSMLRCFFEDTGSAEQNEELRRLFLGLKIMEAGETYLHHMGKYPVISLSLKSARQPSFEDARYQILAEIREEYLRHQSVLKSAALDESEKELYRQLLDGSAPDAAYSTSLKYLSRCLAKAAGQSVIILIDEYDVPLEHAYFHGFYQEMTDFIRSLFESALKTNGHLEFAVVTGCLRISKESIFTGLNHLNTISVLDRQYSEHFGFTEPEVQRMMSDYGRSGRFADMKRWYDGYSFGDSEVYNPWSVIKFLYDLLADEHAYPRPYWANTSSNSIVRTFIQKADPSAKEQIERLLDGETLEIPVHEEVTYDDMDASTEHLWNFLYFTGYLTKTAVRFSGESILLQVRIPNAEIRSIYRTTILSWFQENIRKSDFQDLYRAMECGDTDTMTRILNSQLQTTISFHDSAESFYHGFLAGILSQSRAYIVKSNLESGAGRFDLAVYSPDIHRTAFILELKVAGQFRDLDKAGEAALKQIRAKGYTAALENMGYESFLLYGIGFYRKNCTVNGFRYEARSPSSSSMRSS